MKALLYKSLGSQPLTIEELFAVLADIEAIMNSCPVVPMDSTPADGLEALTPGHFLVSSTTLQPNS